MIKCERSCNGVGIAPGVSDEPHSACRTRSACSGGRSNGHSSQYRRSSTITLTHASPAESNMQEAKGALGAAIAIVMANTMGMLQDAVNLYAMMSTNRHRGKRRSSRA